VTERCIGFHCAGDDLLGILHTPSGPPSRVGLLVVVGGPQYRVGSHRQFVQTARQVASRGHAAFRFDYRGMGDSEGAPRSFEAVDDDIYAAIDAFTAALPGVDRVVIFGLCDAASAAAIYAARQDARVAGLVLLNPWARTEAGEAEAYVRHYYADRLLQRSFWQKLLSGQFRPGDSLRDLLGKLGRMRQSSGLPPSAGDSPGHFLERMRRGLELFPHPVLLAMSGQDLTAREFESYCAKSPAWSAILTRPSLSRTDFPEADHTFSDESSLRRLGEVVAAWLGRL
jgi:exosortase A-associated hydrolase 1